MKAEPLGEVWPVLPLEEWEETCATLHLWLQIVGKVRLRCSPWINHSWHATFYVTVRGLTTSPIPYEGSRVFQINFDFVEHKLVMQTSEGDREELPLEPQSVASFHRNLMERLDRLGLHLAIHPKPNEVAHPVRFDRDERPRPWDAEYALRFWRVLVQVDRVFKEFRSRFIGKCSPVHLFWGAPDLAVSRFSGRRAPEHPGGIPNLPDWITRDAYSHEVSSCGFWPGGGRYPHAAFYSYAYPEPDGFRGAAIQPAQAFYNTDLREYLLPYEAVRRADSPDEILLEFLQSTYQAAAELGRWDRQSLEFGQGDVSNFLFRQNESRSRRAG